MNECNTYTQIETYYAKKQFFRKKSCLNLIILRWRLDVRSIYLRITAPVENIRLRVSRSSEIQITVLCVYLKLILFVIYFFIVRPSPIKIINIFVFVQIEFIVILRRFYYLQNWKIIIRIDINSIKYYTINLLLRASYLKPSFVYSPNFMCSYWKVKLHCFKNLHTLNR